MLSYSKSWLMVGAIAGVSLLSVSCDRVPKPEGNPMVVVSVLPQAYLVDRLAGGLVSIEVMIPPGASAERYEPSIGQLSAVSQAVLYVKVGHPNFPFERAWLDKMIEDRPEIKVVDGAAGLEWVEGDPHLWLSPPQVRRMAINIKEALAGLLPNDQAVLEANLDKLLADIDELDQEIRDGLKPHRGKSFLVFHPAWGYFAKEYGLVQVAIEHEHKEPSPAHLAELIEHAKESGVRVVFVQPQFSPESAQRVAEAIEGRVLAIDPLARDWLANLRKVADTLREVFEE